MARTAVARDRAPRSPWLSLVLLAAGVALLVAAAGLVAFGGRGLFPGRAPTVARAPGAADVPTVAGAQAEGSAPSTDAAQAGVGGCGAVPYAEVDIETRPRLWLEIARTPEQRQLGLMYRQSMPWDSGMLFEFEIASRGGFWMRNTLIPLSIAWLDRDGTIVDIQDMQPLDESVHYPAAAYYFAVEANQGWYEANGVGVGQRMLLCTPTPAP